MTTFNSISEIVNTVANFKPFILVPSYTGEYIPNWGNTIEEDLIITEGNPFFALPGDDILGIQDYLAQESAMLIYIPLTLEALDPKKEFQALLQDPHMTELLNDFEDRYYGGDPMDTDNIYNNIQPAAYEDYDLSYLHK